LKMRSNQQSTCNQQNRKGLIKKKTALYQQLNLSVTSYSTPK